MGNDESDIFRDSPLRYLGYANELGEAFRPLISSKLVKLSYGIATAYVFADTFSKSSQVYNKTKSTKKTLIEGGDVLIWQMLASVAIPGFAINRITWASSRILRSAGVYGRFKFVPTLVGLISIPFIIKPIDNTVDYFMEKTYRQLV